MNGAIAQLRSAGAVSFNIALSTKSQSGTVTDFIVTVTASAKVPTVLMTAYTSNLTAGVSATADNPVFNLTITLSDVQQQRGRRQRDLLLHGAGRRRHALVEDADLQQLPGDVQHEPLDLRPVELRRIELGRDERHGEPHGGAEDWLLALVNITGCNVPYKPNGYGSTLMNVNTMYSHMFPPSKLAYPNVTQNCSLQASTTNAETSGSCAASTPTPGALSCANSNGVSYYYYWNDMGGFKDDLDYNDAVYQVTCNGVGSIYSGLVLTN